MISERDIECPKSTNQLIYFLAHDGDTFAGNLSECWHYIRYELNLAVGNQEIFDDRIRLSVHAWGDEVWHINLFKIKDLGDFKQWKT